MESRDLVSGLRLVSRPILASLGLERFNLVSVSKAAGLGHKPIVSDF